MFSLIEITEQIANATKLSRLLHNPAKYLYAIAFRMLIYPITRKEKIVTASLFYGKKMVIALPASTDIYLTGGKSHPSEIRLAKFIIKNLKPGDHFIDIGAHYGYFSLLASEIVGSYGKILSFEPAGKTFSILELNTRHINNITVFRKAASDSSDPITFYEFPNLYSEYNTSNIDQFKRERWFNDFSPTEVEIPATTIDTITREESIAPKMIKIDVEGAENKVIRGGKELLQSKAPIVIMEYLSSERSNNTHKEALVLLLNLGYSVHTIDQNGQLIPSADIEEYLIQENIDSDNIVFIK